MPFVHIQDANGAVANTSLTASVTLGAAPKQGNLVCVAVNFGNGSVVPTVKVADSNGNQYTVASWSPASVNASSANIAWIAYLLSAPANASATITATFSSISGGAAGAVVDAMEFNYTSGIIQADNNVAGFGTGAAVNSPSITPSSAGALLFAYASPGDALTGVSGAWVEESSGPDNIAAIMAYILSASSGPTAVGFVQAASAPWDAVAASFVLSSPNYSLDDYGQTISFGTWR